MKRLVFALLPALLALAGPALAQDAKGDWAGTLEVSPAVRLRLLVHVREPSPGAPLTGTMDSIDQGSMGIPLSDIVASGETLAFKVAAVAGSYEARWDAAARAWKGEWRQQGMAWPLVLAAAAAQPAPPPMPANWQFPDDGAVAKLIDARIAGRDGEGIVIGLSDGAGRRIVARGPAGGVTFDGRTVFEIGSMSKVFTALLLADMARRGEVGLDDPAAQYLPAGARMPERNGRRITLRDLATHHSGLPRLPDNMPFGDPANPYADYTEARLLDFLGRYQLTRDVGSQFEYSNFGMGLLGYLLARRAGTDYETLLRRRITGPLGMADTVVTLSAAQRARFAQGRDAWLRPARPWDLPTLVGAGGIRSTADDLLVFLDAFTGKRSSPLAPAMQSMLAEPKRVNETPRIDIGLAWMIADAGGSGIAFHDGGTGGFRSTMAWDPVRKRASVILTNAAAEPATNDLAQHIMAGLPVAATPPLPPAPPPASARSEVTLPAAELDRVAGRYELMPNLILTVLRDSAGLRAQISGQPEYPLFAEAPLAFFWKVVDAQVRFTADAEGQVVGAVLIQGGQQLTGKRVAP